MDKIVFEPIHGAQRVLTVYNDHILLEQVQNFRSFLTHDFFNGDKELYYSDMISCQFREGSSLILGYLQFEIPGVSNRNNFGSENSFTFEAALNSHMQKVYEYIRDRIRFFKHGGVQMQMASPQPVGEENDPLDELMKMKKLLDEGIISEEEYNQYKKTLLK